MLGMISIRLYQAVIDANRLFRTDGIRPEQSVGLSVLYQSDVTSELYKDWNDTSIRPAV